MLRLAVIVVALLSISGCAVHYNQAGWEAFQKGDYKAAETAWQEGLKHDAPGAYTGIGILYDPDMPSTGSSGKDIKQAVYYYSKGAEKGEVISMNNLGLLLLRHGNEDDKRAGVKYLTVAARFGFAKAVENLKHLGLPVPDNDLQRAKQNHEIGMALLNIGMMTAINTPSYTPGPVYIPQQDKRNTGCASDLGCGYGQSCIKQVGQAYGVCMTGVDDRKMPTLNAPSPTLAPRTYSDRMCTTSSDCPAGFYCDTQYYSCIAR